MIFFYLLCPLPLLPILLLSFCIEKNVIVIMRVFLRMSEILKSIKARLNRLKKIEEEHKRNTDDIIRQKQNDTQEKCSTQCSEPEKNPDKECFLYSSAIE